MKNNILMLGVGIDQLPAIKKALELGLGVIGLDGNPSAIGQSYVTHFECVDIKNVDKSVDKAMELNKKYGIDGVIAPAVEVGPSVGAIVDKLGLRGIGEKTAHILTDKVIRCGQFDKHRITQPRWTSDYGASVTDKKGNTEILWDTFPAIIKPKDQAGAVGVRYIENKEQLGRYNYDIIQEYLEGWELSVEVLVAHNYFAAIIADRLYDKKLKWKPAVIEDGCVVPSRIPKRIQSKVMNIVQKIITTFSLQNCAIKLDLLVKDNVVYVIECAPRLGGGKLSSEMIPMAWGIDHWKCAIKLAMGTPIEGEDVKPTKQVFAAQRYRFPEVVTSHKSRIESVECIGDTYEEALSNANKAISQKH